MTVTHDQIAERALRVPLEFQNIPETLEITSDPPGMVDVRVRGASGILARLDPGEVVAVVDLRTARPGQRLFHLLTGEVRVPFGIDVSQVSPPTVSITFERSATRVVPIVPLVEGDPAFGFVRGTVTVQPSTVEVIGPESHVSTLLEATTEPINIDNATRPIEDTVTVGLQDSAVRLRTPLSARVRAEILPAPIERAVQNVPVRARNAGRRQVIIEPTTVNLTLRGRREALGRREAAQLDAWVDVANLAPGRYTLRVEVDSRPDFVVSDIAPSSVRVRIR
jgi:YbbR domain-containing protein